MGSHFSSRQKFEFEWLRMLRMLLLLGEFEVEAQKPGSSRLRRDDTSGDDADKQCPLTLPHTLDNLNSPSLVCPVAGGSMEDHGGPSRRDGWSPDIPCTGLCRESEPSC